MYSYVLIAFFFLHLALSFSPFFQTCFSFSAFILSSFRGACSRGGVGFLVGAVVCIVLVLDGPAIAL